MAYTDKLNISYSGYSINDEIHTDVGSDTFQLNHDTILANGQFANSENISIWTDSGQTGTQLIEGTDYEFVNEDTDLSSEVTGNIYINLQVKKNEKIERNELVVLLTELSGIIKVEIEELD